MKIPLPENNAADIFAFGFTKLLNRDEDTITSPVVYDNNERLSVMAQGNIVTSALPGLAESVVDL